jgi:hypothetical protein
MLAEKVLRSGGGFVGPAAASSSALVRCIVCSCGSRGK